MKGLLSDQKEDEEMEQSTNVRTDGESNVNMEEITQVYGDLDGETSAKGIARQLDMVSHDDLDNDA